MSNSVSRRELFKLAGLTAVACCLPLSAQQNSVAQNSKKREFSVMLKHKILEKGNTTRLWIPLPLFREYQYLTSDINFVGNYTKAYISNTQIPTLYAEFENVKSPYLDLSFDIVTVERNIDFSLKPQKVAIPKDIKEYLKATTHIQTDGVVKKMAQEIIKSTKAKGDLAKAKALF